MATYKVTQRIKQYVEYTYEVEAEDEEEAIDKAMAGEGLTNVEPITDEIYDEEDEPDVEEV